MMLSLLVKKRLENSFMDPEMEFDGMKYLL